MHNVICKFKCDLQSPWSANKPHALFILKSSSTETHVRPQILCMYLEVKELRPTVGFQRWKNKFFTIVSLWWEFDSVISYVDDNLGLMKLNSASHYQLNIPKTNLTVEAKFVPAHTMMTTFSSLLNLFFSQKLYKILS